MSGQQDPDARPGGRALIAVIGITGTIAVALALREAAWPAAAFTGLITAYFILGLRVRPLKLVFNVGQHEKHQVVFQFDKFWGTLSITVDDMPKVRTLRLLSIKTTKAYQFQVGEHETHEVRIEKDRSLLLAGNRPQIVRVYVDGLLTAQGAA